MSAGQNGGEQGIIYLLHFPQGLESRPGQFSRHYIGWCRKRMLKARLRRHLEGRGSAFVHAAHTRGLEIVVARTWKGTREEERKLKRLKNGPRLCPLCRAQTTPLTEPEARGTIEPSTLSL